MKSHVSTAMIQRHRANMSPQWNVCLFHGSGCTAVRFMWAKSKGLEPHNAGGYGSRTNFKTPQCLCGSVCVYVCGSVCVWGRGPTCLWQFPLMMNNKKELKTICLLYCVEQTNTCMWLTGAFLWFLPFFLLRALESFLWFLLFFLLGALESFLWFLLFFLLGALESFLYFSFLFVKSTGIFPVISPFLFVRRNLSCDFSFSFC